MVAGFVPKIAKNDVIARSMTFDGRPVTVHHIVYNDDFAGIGKESYSVHIGGAVGQPETVYGFKSEDDTNRFLTSWDNEEFDTVDRNGQASKDTRQGLGLADAMISRAQSQASTKKSSPVVDVTSKGNA